MKRVLITTLLLTTAWLLGQSDGRGQTSQSGFSARNVKYPTMLDMTFPEFEETVKKTDIVRTRLTSPLGTDAMNATAQVV